MNKMFKETNPMWKGGKTIASTGYVLIRTYSERPGALAYRYEHHIVMEELLGRPLKKGEEVHHIDGNKQNNSPSNLELCEEKKFHKVHHRKLDSNLQRPNEENSIAICRCGCKQTFLRFDKYGRPRMYICGHNRRIALN